MAIRSSKTEGLADAGESYRAAGGTKNTTDDGGVRYEIRADAPAEIHKAVTDKNYGGDIRLTDTSPSIMLGHKGVKNLPMLMKASHIRENILSKEEVAKMGLKVGDNINYHGLGEDLFKKVIDSLDDITTAYRGTAKADNPDRRKKYFLLISTVKDGDGNTINIPVYINETANYNRVIIKTNKIATVYGKENLKYYIRNEITKGNLVRIKRRGTTSSESPAPIAVDYAGVTSAEEAADQTAMASYGKKISQSRPDVKHQSRHVAAVERANRSLERQNAKLKEDIKGLKKLLRLQKSVTKGRLFDPRSVDCIARYKGAAWS